MNKRIKNLAEQAGEYVNSVYTPPVRSKTPGKIWEDGHIGWNEQFQEKFAELIVHQMLDITDAHTEVFQTDRDKALIEHIKQSVKQHFGVEE